MCNHLPGHSDDCPCCETSCARTVAEASATSCHCGRDPEPATASAPQGEGILAKLPTLPRASRVDTLASRSENPRPEVAPDPPEPVPRRNAA
jgi:hypothetical protein